MRRLSQYEKDKELRERKTKLHLDDISPVRDLLKKTLSLAPRLHDALMATPRNHGSGHKFIQNTLAHPNLIASNILVSKRTPPPEEVYVKGRKLLTMFPGARLAQQTYVDWFGASVRPVFMQMTVPPFVAYKAGVIRRYAGPLESPSILPSILASVFSDADRKLFEWHKNLVMREKEWSYAWRESSDFYGADMHPFYWPLANLPSAVSRVMERHDGDGPLVLRALLMQIHDYWDGYRDNVVDRGPRPFSFTKQEIDRHSAEWNWLIREQGISWLGLEAEAAQEQFLSERYYDDLKVSKASSSEISS